MTALTTTASNELLLEYLAVLKSNLAALNSAVSSMQADAATLTSKTGYNAAQLSLYQDSLVTVAAAVVSKRGLVDDAVSNIEMAIDGLNSLISGSSDGTGTSYKSITSNLNGLRDACSSFYSSYYDVSAKITALENDVMVAHSIQSWSTTHGPVVRLIHAYSDSAENLIGDSVIKLPVSSNSTTYNFTTNDIAAGASANTLYIPGDNVEIPVFFSKIHERCTSPYLLGDTKLNWVLFMPPEIRQGIYQKYMFVQCGTTGIQRWQYKDSDGNWSTLADLAITKNVNYYAAYSGQQTLKLPGQDGGTPATVTYNISISRTSYGGCAEFEPVGPAYPPQNRLFVSPLRVLILNSDQTTCHRTVVKADADRLALTPSLNQRVFVSDTSTQYIWTGTAWQTSKASDYVDQINFSGLGIYRQYCEYQ